jgi:Domain of unknown function DUF29
MNWQDLAATSPFRTALAVEQALHQGNVAEANLGLQELIDALSRSDKRALRSHLTRLMAHVIRWQAQPANQCRSWRATINNSRREIAEIQEETPSLDRKFIASIWNGCLHAARDEAEADMDFECSVTTLSWEDVFEKTYELNRG